MRATRIWPHGSNVRDIETIASYDIATREFVIDTPGPQARKDYIGNAALHARMATVFAQLEVNGQQHGVHAFLVPIRDEQGRVLPGIEIEDCGRKIGLNGFTVEQLNERDVNIAIDTGYLKLVLDDFGGSMPLAARRGGRGARGGSRAHQPGPGARARLQPGRAAGGGLRRGDGARERPGTAGPDPFRGHADGLASR